MNQPVDFSNVDWEKRDVDIAYELGCSRELVRRKRKKLGKAPSPFHKQGVHAADRHRFKKDAEWLAEHTLEEIAERHAVSVDLARYLCGVLKLPFKRTNNNIWPFVDLSLPTKVLAKIWKNVSPGAINSQRSRTGLVTSHNYTVEQVQQQREAYKQYIAKHKGE